MNTRARPAVGASVITVKVGDKAAIDPNIYRQTCYYCRSGRKQHCENLTAIGVNRNGGSQSTVLFRKQVYARGYGGLRNRSNDRAARLLPARH